MSESARSLPLADGLSARYRTIVIDPPWPGPGEVPAFSSAIVSGAVPITILPYTTMSGIQVAALRVPEIAAPDAQLFLWATTRSLGDAYLLCQTWGFRYRGTFVWKKQLGLGRHMRHDSEFVVWGGRRGAPLVEPKRCPAQTQHWPKPRRHSEKPGEAYALFAELSPPPRIDIFARQAREGWDRWGNEA